MDDQGFDFRKSPERREPKRFEPPPWERDAFPVKPPGEDSEERPAGEAGEEPELVSAPEAYAASEGPAVEAPGETDSSSEQSDVANAPSEAEMIELLAGLAQEIGRAHV